MSTVQTPPTVNTIEVVPCGVYYTSGYEPLSQDVRLLRETIAPRANLPPLLCRLADRPPEQLDYVGVAYGLTLQLFRYILTSTVE